LSLISLITITLQELQEKDQCGHVEVNQSENNLLTEKDNEEIIAVNFTNQIVFQDVASSLNPFFVSIRRYQNNWDLL